jgi:hypothetical protein
MEMVQIAMCSVANCAYNKNNMCHTPGINVGAHGECNTYIHASGKGGFSDVKGRVGACLAAGCKFNEELECSASHIDVAMHEEHHADCETFHPVADKTGSAEEPVY